MGMRFEYWEVGFEKKLGWEMGLVPPPPLQDPQKRKGAQNRKVVERRGKGGEARNPWGKFRSWGPEVKPYFICM